MMYDLTNEHERSQAIHAFKRHLDKNNRIELTKKAEKRTLKQNSYLHLIVNYFAVESGYPTDFVKREFFKCVCNNEMFVVILSGALGEIKHLKSTKELNTEQMSIAINRFKDWSSIEAGILLPDAEDVKFIQHCENEVSKHENRIYR